MARKERGASRGGKQRKRSRIDNVPDRRSIKKDWTTEYRQETYGLLVSDLHGQYVERNSAGAADNIPLTREERRKYLQSLMVGRLPRNYWRHVLKAGGCQSKKQAVAVRLWAGCDGNGIPILNGKDVPKSSRKWELLADMMNRLGYRTDTGESWKKPRMQQYVYAGLAWMIVMDSLRGGFRPVRSLEDMQHDVCGALWDVLRSKRKARKNRPTEVVQAAKVHTITRISLVDGSRETVTIPRQPINWSAKREAARLRDCGPNASSR